LQLAFPVDPRANVTHFAELVKRCVFEKHGAGVVIQQRETFLLRSTLHIVVQLHKDPRCGCLVVRDQIDSALGLEKGLGVNDQQLCRHYYVAALCGCPREHILPPCALARSTPREGLVVEFCPLQSRRHQPDAPDLIHLHLRKNCSK